MTDRIESLVEAVESQLGASPEHVTPMGKGSARWKVEFEDRAVVVKAGLIERLNREAWGYGLAKDAGVPVPDVLGLSPAEKGRAWLMLSLIAAPSLSAWVSAREKPAALLHSVGASLKRLHDVHGTGFGEPQLSGTVHGPFPTWRAWVLSRFESHLDRLRSAEILDDMLEGEVRRAVERDEAALDLCTRPALIHGDFVPRHILVDPEASTMVALLDFEAVAFGDPAYDFAVFSLLARNSLPELIDGYGPDSEALVSFDRRMRLYRLLRRVEEVWWGHHRGRSTDVRLERLREAARPVAGSN